jgi:Kef-type K+ transport system membrane component KefB
MLGFDGWIGPKAMTWQFVVGVGMACAVTALPILILLMEKLEVLRQPIGQRILRYASLDDVAIWAVLALILMDWERMGRQAAFLLTFAVAARLFHKLMARLGTNDRWYAALIWLAVVFRRRLGRAAFHGRCLPGRGEHGSRLVRPGKNGSAAPPCAAGHHAGVFPVHRAADQLECRWFGCIYCGGGAARRFRGGQTDGVRIAGSILKWRPGEASIIGWLLQTKALIMIIFANILLDKQIITSETFTALLLMAVASTMLTVPMVAPKLARLQSMIQRSA